METIASGNTGISVAIGRGASIIVAPNSSLTGTILREARRFFCC